MNAPAVFPRVETPHRFTVEDVWRMVEAGVIAPDASLEILDGEIIDMPAEGKPHLTFKMRLNRLLVTLAGDDWGVMPDGTLHLAAEDAPQPDFYVLPADTELKPVDPSAVALVIEIADTSLGYDLGRKAGKYAQFGLAEYWVVDVNVRVTHVLTLPENGAYRDIARVPFDQTLTAARLPTVFVRFDDLVPPEGLNPFRQPFLRHFRSPMGNLSSRSEGAFVSPERMKPYRLSAFLFLLVVYLGVQSLTGERGLLTGAAREARLVEREAQLAALTEQRADLEVRVRYLKTDSLSRDLLEERAGAVLGFSDPRDYVIRVAAPATTAPVAASL